jgi:hypothetical protein
LEAKYRLKEEVLTEPFEISTGVIIMPGSYSFYDYGISIVSSEHRKLSGTASVFKGTDYDGKRLSLVGGVAWKPSRHLSIQGTYEFSSYELPEGSFTARLMILQANLAFSDTLSWVNLLQYDNVSNGLGINSRFRWIPEAGREMFLVINKNLQDGIDGFKSTDSNIAVKVTYTLRF